MPEPVTPDSTRAAVQELRRLIEAVNRQAGRCAHLGLTVRYESIPDERLHEHAGQAPILYAEVERIERY